VREAPPLDELCPLRVSSAAAGTSSASGRGEAGRLMEVGPAPTGSTRADAECAPIGKDAEQGGQNTECGYRAEHIE